MRSRRRREDDRSLFFELGRLAGSSQRENQLSRTFAACFQESLSFRELALNVLRRVARVPDAQGNPTEWSCTAEVATPIPGGGRVDLRFTRRRARGDVNIHFESKVESPLTKAQLVRYQDSGVENLVVVTKYPPELTASELQQIGVPAVRWQDFHRALVTQENRKPLSRYLVHTFARYLEELGMAHPEDITLADVELCRRILRTAGSNSYDHISPRDGFAKADACISVLSDVRRQFIELHPKAAACRRWGPGYFVWHDDHGRKLHALGWNLEWGSARREGWFGCRLWIPDDNRAFAWAAQSGTRHDEADQDQEVPLSRMTNRAGALEPKKLLGFLGESAKRWRLFA